MLLHSDHELVNSYRSFLDKHEKVIIFSPYIKLSALRCLVSGYEDRISTIVTSWVPIDIAVGATDIDIYSFCVDKNIQLLINNKIHLKTLLDADFNECIVSSSNITNKGLAISKFYNYELGTIVSSLATADRCYFDVIFDTAELVTESYFKETLELVEELSNTIENIPKQFERSTSSKQRFLTSELPYFEDPQKLHQVVSNQDNYSDEYIRSAFHDLRLYNIESSIDEDDFKKKLRQNFLQNEFIKQLLRFNSEGKFFGEITAWLHNMIENVPSPKRFEVKEYQKRIYSYIEYLLEDDYSISVPKNHSQYLKRNKVVV